jgi:hypothetical protein
MNVANGSTLLPGQISGPLLVAAPPEDDSVLRGDESGEVGLHLVVPVEDELVGALGNAVEGQQLVATTLRVTASPSIRRTHR